MVWMKTLIFQENLNLPPRTSDRRSVGTEKGPEQEKVLTNYYT